MYKYSFKAPVISTYIHTYIDTVYAKRGTAVIECLYTEATSSYACLLLIKHAVYPGTYLYTCMYTHVHVVRTYA